MRVTLERSNLLKALNHVQRVVERRNTIPILSNVLLKADGAALMLKATDLDLEVTEETAASVGQGGATTVSAHMLYDIVRKLPDGSEVMMTVGDDNGMQLVSGRSQFRLQMLPETDFPDLTAGEFKHMFRMACDDLKRLIDRTQFAISTEETRYYLNGIYFHGVDGDEGPLLRAVATDGHRLAQAQTAAPDGAEGLPGIIVPRKTVGELQKLLEAPDSFVTVEVSETKIRFTVDQVVLTSKLIDGTFPDYNRVIPTGNDKTLKLDRASFAAAVDRVSTIASDRGRAVKLSLTDSQLVLSVNNPDSGSAEEELAVNYGADSLDIGFNSRYLLDITNQLSADETTFMLADPGSPTLIQEDSDAGALYVLMPMRV
ncbi:MAG: DNA polymerase III subunit beta [Pseudomonadota bacterium]